MNRLRVISILTVMAATAAITNAQGARPTLVVTLSNTQANELLVYDAAGTPVQSISTQGQGGASGNAGGIATQNGIVAAVNFGSQTVAIFERRGNGFEFRRLVSAVSAPVSVAFSQTHLYVLGVTTVESHRIVNGEVDVVLDGTVALLRADGSAAQVGVAGNQLVISEKSGAIEVVSLQNGVVAGNAVSVPLPAGGSDTPFGLVTRGSNAYVTIAHSDLIALVKNGRFVAAAATGTDFPNGPGQQSPCWIALVGPYLYSANTPSHSISRLVATGGNVILDEAVAALVPGNPGDVAGDGDVLAVVESDGGNPSHLTLFRIDEGGGLTQVATVPVTTGANGVAIVPGR